MQFGWLLFRETNPHYLLRYLSLSPFAMTRADVQAGAYLLLLAGVSAPIFVHDWRRRGGRRILGRTSPRRSRARELLPVVETLWQGALCGTHAGHHPGAPQPHQPRLHLLPVLTPPIRCSWELTRSRHEMIEEDR